MKRPYQVLLSVWGSIMAMVFTCCQMLAGRPLRKQHRESHTSSQFKQRIPTPSPAFDGPFKQSRTGKHPVPVFARAYHLHHAVARRKLVG